MPLCAPLLPFLTYCSNSVPCTLCLVASYVLRFFFPVFEHIFSCTCNLSAANLLLQYLHVSRSSLATADFGNCLAEGLAVDGAFTADDCVVEVLFMACEGVLFRGGFWDCCDGEGLFTDGFVEGTVRLTIVFLIIGCNIGSFLYD